MHEGTNGVTFGGCGFSNADERSCTASQITGAAWPWVAGNPYVVAGHSRNRNSPAHWAAHRLPGGQCLPKRPEICQHQRRPIPQVLRRAERQRVRLLEQLPERAPKRRAVQRGIEPEVQAEVKVEIQEKTRARTQRKTPVSICADLQREVLRDVQPRLRRESPTPSFQLPVADGGVRAEEILRNPRNLRNLWMVSQGFRVLDSKAARARFSHL